METEGTSQVEFVGYDRDGAQRTVRLPAGADPTEIEERIREDGGRVLFARLTRPERARPRGVSPEEFARFNDMLASAIKRGVPLLQGVREIARDVRRSRFRRNLERVADRLARGESLHDAFEPESTEFPRLYGNLLEAGAAAGDLPRVLVALGRNIRTDVTFRRGVLEAFVYPAFVFIMCCIFLSGFTARILPRYTHAADEIDMAMPQLTDIMTAQAGSGRLVLSLVAGAILGLITVWFFWLRKLRLGHMIGEALARKTPVLRRMYEAAVWSSAADTLALLFRARVPAPIALRLVGPATGTRWLTGAFSRLAAAIEGGTLFSDAAFADAEVPHPFACAVEMGEARGDLASAMTTLATEYRDNSSRRAQALLRYLPPTLAVVFGVMVLLTALTVLGPYIRFWGAGW